MALKGNTDIEIEAYYSSKRKEVEDQPWDMLKQILFNSLSPYCIAGVGGPSGERTWGCQNIEEPCRTQLLEPFQCIQNIVNS